MLLTSLKGTKRGAVHFVSFLQHAVLIRYDSYTRSEYWRLLDLLMSQLILGKQRLHGCSGLDPDFGGAAPGTDALSPLLIQVLEGVRLREDTEELRQRIRELEVRNEHLHKRNAELELSLAERTGTSTGVGILQDAKNGRKVRAMEELVKALLLRFSRDDSLYSQALDHLLKVASI